MSDNGIKIIDLLPSDLGDVGGVVKHEIEVHSTNPTSTVPAAWNLIQDSATDKLKEALNFDLVELFAIAWSKVNELKEYANPKRHPPEQVSIVHLGSHDLVLQNYPQIDVEIVGLKVCSLRFTLNLSAAFKTVALTIRDGKIWSIAFGECAAKADLKYGDTKLAHKETPAVKLPFKIDLKNPIRIVHTPAG